MSDYKITIELKDVAKGDVQGLVEHLELEVGPDFDIARGDFVVSCSEKIGDTYFPVELVGDDSW